MPTDETGQGLSVPAQLSGAGQTDSPNRHGLCKYTQSYRADLGN